MNRRLKNISLAATGALTLALIPAAAASADSIVYIDGGNVWSAKPDGSHKVQLTDGGRWHSPTQADDGTIAAVDGTGPIVVMKRDGEPLRTITTPSAKSSNGGTFSPRPLSLSFSPDGSKIAYSYVEGSCPPAAPCGTRYSTFYTRADVTTATPHAELGGNEYGAHNPEWISNDKALTFGGYGRHVNIDDLDNGDYNAKHWFDGAEDLGDGELSRDGKRLVTTWSYGKNLQLVFWAVKGDPRTEVPAAPVPACNTTGADEKFGDPSWSPDGTQVAWQSSHGIEVLTFTKLDETGCASTGDAKVLTATGTNPDWGPADPPAKRWTKPVEPTPTATATATPTSTPGKGTPTATPTPGGKTPGESGGVRAIAATVPSTVKFGSGKLRVTARPDAAGTVAVKATVKIAKKTYTSKTATKTARAANEALVLELTWSASAKKAIKKALRKKSLQATVTFTSGAVSTKKIVTLKK